MIISAIVLARNEEENIEKCLNSLNFCDEIIVIDDYSKDRTANIAAKYGAKVYQHHLNNDFSEQRNYALELSQGDWILFIDADEVVSGELQEEIQNSIKDKYISGYSFKRYDFLWNRILKHGEIGNIRIIRLARKGTGKWARKVHEFWQIDGTLKEMQNPIYHYPHQDLSQFIDHINMMSTLHAEANNKEGKRSSILKIIIYPVLKFILNLIFRFGFLDGYPGLITTFVMSLHSYLSWGKLWLIQRK